MYTLLNDVGLQKVLRREFLPMMVALVIAQLFFKWGSFALELVGFIFLWFALGFLSGRLLDVLRK